MMPLHFLRNTQLRWPLLCCLLSLFLSASVGCGPDDPPDNPIDEDELSETAKEPRLPVDHDPPGDGDIELEIQPDLDAQIALPPDLFFPTLCDEEPEHWAPRPRWGELTSGTPDYQNLSSNLDFLDSIKLLISMFSKATAKLENVQEVTTGQVNGNCLCNCDFGATQMPNDVELSALGDWIDANAPQYSACFDDNLTRPECNTYCAAVPTQNPNLTLAGNDPVQVWNSNDIFLSVEIAGQSVNIQKRTVLELVHMLDGVSAYLQSIQFQGVLDALGAAGAGLQNLQQLLTSLLAYVDQFTSGYHLGAYSPQRPDLHMCVGYAGHAVFAQMGNLGGERASIGARYSGHNLSRSHRAQFRTGGFAVNAFGKSLSLMPAAEANIQVDGFGFWNTEEPFGIPASTNAITADQIEDHDIFQLVEPGEFDILADSNGDIYIPGSLFISNYYPATYISAQDGQSYQWPRPDNPKPWEKPSVAIMSAGLNLALDLDPLELELPTVTVFPGANITPYFKMGAGVEWTHDAYVMRNLIRDKINENIPASAQLDDADFAREMHAMQAPDVSEDNGTTAYVTPEIGANLLFGLKLAKWLELGIFANVGVGVKIEPGGWGGVVDLNYALIEALTNSNPPADAECKAVVEAVKGQRCTNTALGDQSQAELSCEADADNPCAALGYCVDANNNILGADLTRAECETLIGNAPPPTPPSPSGAGRCCLPPNAITWTVPPWSSARCDINQEQCLDKRGEWVAGGVCSAETDLTDCSDPNDAGANGDTSDPFKPYRCVEISEPEVTGWEGPGCHPLGTGYQSACGCDTDADCTSAESCNDDGLCVDAQTDAYVCSCDPQDPDACGEGRTCSQGACVMACATSTDCAQGLSCDGGYCRPPHGIPTAEEIVWGMQNVDAPLHAVSSYALSDLLLWAYLTAGIDIKMSFQIFGASREFSLFDWSDLWEIASNYKIWYQPGLEARYQDQCSPELGAVTNHQPQSVTVPGGNLPADYLSGYVERYPETPLSSVYEGNAGSTETFIDWCKDTMKEDVANPPAPQPSDIGDSLTDLVDWGEDIGMDLWTKHKLCVNGQPLEEWAQNVDGSLENLDCEYTDPTSGQTHYWACRDALFEVVEHWGCLQPGLSQAALALALDFPHLIVGGVFDLDQMLIDPSDQLSAENLKPQYRYAITSTTPAIFSAGEVWMGDVESCFDTRWDAESVCECSSDQDCQQGLQQVCGAQNRCVSNQGSEVQCSIFTAVAQPGPCGGACHSEEGCVDLEDPSDCEESATFYPGEKCG